MRAAGEGERNSDIPPRRTASLGRVLACLVLGSTPSTRSAEKRTPNQKVSRYKEAPGRLDGGNASLLHVPGSLESVCVGGVRRGELGGPPDCWD